MIYTVLRFIEELSKQYDQFGIVVDQRFAFILILSVYAAIYLVCFIFKGLGLYTIAKREGIKSPGLAFVPFASFYLLGKIIGTIRVFGYRIKNLGLLTMILLILNVTTSLALQILVYRYNLVSLFTNGTIGVLPDNYGSNWVDVVLNIASLISALLYIISYVFLVSAFFMYYARNMQILFTLLSVLFDPIFGIFVFISRKAKRFNYSQYMKMRFDSYNANRAAGGFNNPQTPFTREENPFEEKNPYSAYEHKRPSEKQDIDVFEDYKDYDKSNNAENGSDSD